MKTTLLLYLSLVMLGVTGVKRTFAQTDQPNILMIIVDDLNDYVGYLNGHPQTRTPNLDAISRRATVFHNAYCPSPTCTPSRTSLMTGKDPIYTGIYSNSGPYTKTKAFREALQETTGGKPIFTLPELLKDSGGYFTANFHKIYHGWRDQGYDNDFDSLSSLCDKSGSWNFFMDFGLSEDQFPDTSGFGGFYHGMSGMAMGPLQNSQQDSMNDTRVVSKAIEFLSDYSENPGNYCNRPFFAAVGIFRPHLPFFVPERFFYDQYERDFDLMPYPVPYNQPADLWPPNGIVHAADPKTPGADFFPLSDFAKELARGLYDAYEDFEEFPGKLQSLPQISPGLDSIQAAAIVTESQQTNALMAYLASVYYADNQIGRLTKVLENLPEIADNTIIIILSDNGYSFREHRHYHKFALWETDIRVPLLIYDPRNPGGSKETLQPTNLLDLFPTILDITGIAQPRMPNGETYADGISLIPMLQTPGALINRPAVSVARAPRSAPIPGSCFDQFSVRNQDWHYIRYRTDDGSSCDSLLSDTIEELYQIGIEREIDPEEWNNLADDPAFQPVKSYLSQWLPEGPLYNKTAGGIKIKGKTCGSNIMLTAKHQGPETVSSYTWHVNGTPSTGSSLTISPLEPVSVVLTADCGDYFLLDATTLYPGALDASFSATVDGSIVSVSTTDDRESNWTYGDGFKIKGKPVSHQYASPGFYKITRRLGDGDCAGSDSTTVYIDTTAFENLCIPPQDMRTYRVGFNKAEVRWSPVYGATAYEFTFRPRFTSGTQNWQSIVISDTSITMFQLVPDKDYAYRVRSIYSDCTSDWSFARDFTTKACDPPSKARLETSDETGFEISWTPGILGEITGQQIGYLNTTGGPPQVFNKGPEAASLVVEGLHPGGSYFVRGRSVCTQYGGSKGYSSLSAPLQVDLAGLKMVNLAPQEDVWPAGLYDLYGRKLLDLSRSEIEEVDQLERLIPDWLPAGVYFIGGQLVSKF